MGVECRLGTEKIRTHVHVSLSDHSLSLAGDNTSLKVTEKSSSACSETKRTKQGVQNKTVVNTINS